MTISSETNKVISPGDGGTFTFSFSPLVVYDEDDIAVDLVTVATGTSVSLTRGTGSNNFSVSLTSPNDLPSTGSIVYPADQGTALTSASELVIRYGMTLGQETDLENRGGYAPDTVEQQLDKLALMILQQQEMIDRSYKVGLSSAEPAADDFSALLNTINDNLADITTAADTVTAAGLAADITTLAALDTEITALGAISADITTVAGISADVTSVAAALPLGGAASEEVQASGVGDLLREDGDGSALTGITDAAFELSGDTSPAQLTANTDNWAIAATVAVVRFSTDASRNITGVANGADGRILILHNIGSNNAVLKHDVTSTAANRFYTPNNSDFTLSQNESVALQYDSTSSRWRVLAQADPSAADALAVVGTATASGSANITITGIDTTYPTYLCVAEDLIPATDGARLQVLLGDSGGLDTGASDYKWDNPILSETGTGTAIECQGNGTSSNNFGNGTGESGGASFYLHAARGTGYPSVQGNVYAVNSAGQPLTKIFAGTRMAAITTDRIAVKFNTGNITSGRFTVYGIKTS